MTIELTPMRLFIGGLSVLILILIGLVAGWKWIAPATTEIPQSIESYSIEPSLIGFLETSKFNKWKIEKNTWSYQKADEYTLTVYFDNEILILENRDSLDSFLSEASNILAFTNE